MGFSIGSSAFRITSISNLNPSIRKCTKDRSTRLWTVWTLGRKVVWSAWLAKIRLGGGGSKVLTAQWCVRPSGFQPASSQCPHQRKQSNSRVIKWSDGSMSIQVGDEIFDLTVNMDLPTTTAPKPFTSAAGSQPEEIPTTNNVSRDQGVSYLFSQRLQSQILQAEAAITGTLALKPTGMHSEAHIKVAKAVAQKHTKTTRLRMAADLTKEDIDRQAEASKAVKRPSNRRRPSAMSSPRKKSSTKTSSKRDMTEYTDEEEGSDDSYTTPRRSGRFSESGSKKPRSGEYETDGVRAKRDLKDMD